MDEPRNGAPKIRCDSNLMWVSWLGVGVIVCDGGVIRGLAHLHHRPSHPHQVRTDVGVMICDVGVMVWCMSLPSPPVERWMDPGMGSEQGKILT